MEGLNYEIMKMINEFQILRARQEESAAKAGDRDGYGYPFEPSDLFGTTPLGFLETTMRLQTEAAEAFRFLREINRHSPLYHFTFNDTYISTARITKIPRLPNKRAYVSIWSSTYMKM